jgi:hypothetical protein
MTPSYQLSHSKMIGNALDLHKLHKLSVDVNVTKHSNRATIMRPLNIMTMKTRRTEHTQTTVSCKTTDSINIFDK